MNNRVYHLYFSEPGIREKCIEELSDFFAHSAMYEDYLKTDKIRIICGGDTHRWQVSFCIFVAASSKTHPNIKSVLNSLGYVSIQNPKRSRRMFVYFINTKALF